jgi:predicted nucleotidyltransferase
MLTKEQVIQILHEFKEDVKNILGDNFVEMILFGSYARGDYREDSDVDVLIVVKEKNKSVEKIVSDIAYRYFLNINILISFIITERNINSLNYFLRNNVVEEGVKIE